MDKDEIEARLAAVKRLAAQEIAECNAEADAREDEFDARMAGVIRVTVRCLAGRLDMKFTKAQRQAVSGVIEAALYRWMDNQHEMFSGDDDAAPEPIDQPAAGSA